MERYILNTRDKNTLVALIVVLSVSTGALWYQKFFSDQPTIRQMMCEIKENDAMIKNLKSELGSYVVELKSLYNLRSLEVVVTAYTATEKECDSTPNENALMDVPVAGLSCAVSRDLIYLLGKKIYITGYGVRVVDDLMNERFNSAVDLFVGKKAEAIKIGKTTRVLVVLN